MRVMAVGCEYSGVSTLIDTFLNRSIPTAALKMRPRDFWPASTNHQPQHAENGNGRFEKGFF